MNWELQKNSRSYLELNLEAIFHETTIVLKTTTHKKRHAGHWLRSKDNLISDILVWFLTHGRSSVGWPGRTYLQQLCVDTGRSLEDGLERWMIGTDGLREREKKIGENSCCHHDLIMKWKFNSDELDSLSWTRHDFIYISDYNRKTPWIGPSTA